MIAKGICPTCNSECDIQVNHDTDTIFYVCPICGRYQVTVSGRDLVDDNRLAAYLYYNRFLDDSLFENRYHTTMSKEKCDEYRKQYNEGNNTHGRPVHMDTEMLTNWYPKTFSERVDYILLRLNTKAKHVGASVNLSYAEALSLLFVDRKEKSEEVGSGNYGKMVARDEVSCEEEAAYMLNYLAESELIRFNDGPSQEEAYDVVLLPKGYSRIDELLKNTSNGRNAFVAMQFGEDTKSLREAIRKGITDAGYIAILIDEVQHNDFITPELLKHIRDSKFVVVDLSHQNNGAYLEEGYAMGLGKPVIQLCRKNTKLHFDIAQKNTIKWETEDDIPKRLENRILATID